MVQLLQAAKIMEVKNNFSDKFREDSKIQFNVNGEDFEIYLTDNSQKESYTSPCYQCIYNVASSVIASGSVYCSDLCYYRQPTINLTHTIVNNFTKEFFIINRIFIDGDPIYISSIEFDILFYTNYVNYFISSETELISFLNKFNSSFSKNLWYIKSNGAWLHKLISESKWNSLYLKALFGCIQYEDGLEFLNSEELKQYGYELILRAFNIKYANTSSSIVSDFEVANKLENLIPRAHFSDYINQILEQKIQSYKTRKKTYYDFELNEWRKNDGSADVKRKIFLSQFGKYSEYEAKRSIIQKLIRQAENEVRIEKGFNIVGTLANESILFTKLKTYFSYYSIISQYRPKWLGRQSLDIYIEELKIAIEYQGEQHSRPVDFYGGIQAFELTKLRDEKKRDRCQRNGCKLIYVYPDYDFENVINQIMELASNNFKR